MPEMFVLPFRPAYDANGKFIPGAKAWFTLSYTNIPTPVYSDASMSVALANPVVANASGRFPVSYLDPDVVYRVRIYDDDVKFVDGAPLGGSTPLEEYDPYTGAEQGSQGATGSGAPGLSAYQSAVNAGFVGTEAAWRASLNGVNGGVGSSAGYGALFNAANGMSVGTGITRVKLSGYSTAGIGGADYIYDAAVNGTTVAANPRTQFLAADGRGFKLDPDQRLTIGMFGIVEGGDNATNGVSNLAGILAAIDFTPKSDRNFTPTVHWPVGTFYVSGTINVHSVVHWRGAGTGNNGGSVQGTAATRIIAPTNTCVIINHNSNTTETGVRSPTDKNFSASGSIYFGLSFEQQTWGTDPLAYAFWMRGTASLYECSFVNIASHAFYAYCTAGAGGLLEGNANNWVLDRCFAINIRGNALHLRGQDVNAGLSTMFYTAGATIQGCGIMDASGLLNTHVAPQITGYGNTGVSYLGHLYQFVGHPSLAADIGGTTTPGTDDNVWWDLGVGALVSFPEWVPGATYTLKLPIFASGLARVFGGYCENSTCRSHAPMGFIDGPFECTTVTSLSSNNSGVRTFAHGVGSYRNAYQRVDSPYYAKMGKSASVSIGNQHPTDPYERPNILSVFVEQDGASAFLYWKWTGKDSFLGYQNAKPYAAYSGPLTARTYGRSTAQPYYMEHYDPVLRDPGNSNNARIIGMRAAVPTTFNQAVGEYYFNTNPAAGLIGWSCKTAGTTTTAGTFGKDYLNERSSPTVGVGYIALAGGAVTQATSKATAVTLNNVCGAITMEPTGSIAANSAVSFTLTNSTIAATDLIPPPSIKSGATAGAYVVTVDAVANGSCRISVRNTTAGALAEALVLNFAVIKAVAA